MTKPKPGDLVMDAVGGVGVLLDWQDVSWSIKKIFGDNDLSYRVPVQTESGSTVPRELKGLINLSDPDVIEVLDEKVHDAKSHEASTINNQGPYEQVLYILEGESVDALVKELRDAGE